MMSSPANTILFLALVTTSIIVAVMYVKLRRLGQYHAEYQRIFDKTEAALTTTHKAVTSFGTEGKETLTLLGSRIEEARDLAKQLELLTQSARQISQARPDTSNH